MGLRSAIVKATTGHTVEVRPSTRHVRVLLGGEVVAETRTPLVLRETVYHLEECSFDRCNWHVDCVLMWGSPQSLQEIKAVVTLIEQGQKQLAEAEAKERNGAAGGPAPASPFAS